MKKPIYLALGALALLGACSDEPNPSNAVDWSALDFRYDAEGVWADNAEDVNIVTPSFTFRHYLSAYGTVEGFTLSRSTDTEWHEEMFLHAYTVLPAGGPEGKGTPFLVGYWSSFEGLDPHERSLTVARTDSKPFTPGVVKVTNTCYVYYMLREGSDFSRPFAKGDWFKVTAHGVPAQGGEETTTEFYLANCGDDPMAGIITTWEPWDLSPLGEVESLYFTLDSSDTGLWGMNTPAYFALSGMSLDK